MNNTFQIFPNSNLTRGTVYKYCEIAYITTDLLSNDFFLWGKLLIHFIKVFIKVLNYVYLSILDKV